MRDLRITFHLDSDEDRVWAALDAAQREIAAIRDSLQRGTTIEMIVGEEPPLSGNPEPVSWIGRLFAHRDYAHTRYGSPECVHQGDTVGRVEIDRHDARVDA